MNPEELKLSLAKIVAALAVLAALTSLTPEQAAEFEAKKAEAEKLKAQIARLEYVAAEQSRIATVPAVPRPAAPAATARAASGRRVIENPGFASLGELVCAARFSGTADSRVRALMEVADGTSGGIAVPDEHNPLLMSVAPQGSIFRGRATVIPAGESPDAEVSMPALNQGASANMFGGVEVSWIGEGVEKPETNAKLREITWKAHEVAGHIVVTDKLLRNWRAAGPFLEAQLRNAILAAEDYAFLRGNGLGRPLGVIASPATKFVNRTTANTVKYADLVAMEAELIDEGTAVWVVAKRVVPKLRLMEDTEGHLIWQDSARDGGLPTLLGRPVVVNHRSPALGAKGDVVLAELKQYCIKEGFGLQVRASEHVFFKNNKTVIKAFQTVGGAPWLDAPVSQEDGQTYSYFVGLDVPA